MRVEKRISRIEEEGNSDLRVLSSDKNGLPVLISYRNKKREVVCFV